MIYLYDNAIVDDLKRSFNPENVPNPLVKVTSPEESIGLAAQIQGDQIQFPIVALNRGTSITLDETRMNFSRLHTGVGCVFDVENNIFYDEKAVPINLTYDLTVLTTRVADMDEIIRELIFKYTQMYFLTIQLPYESDRKIRFGVSMQSSEIERSSATLDYIEGGKLHQSILSLKCDGCVLVTYTPRKLRVSVPEVQLVNPTGVR